MQSIKFIKEPGYIFDLIFLFALYFNKDYALTHFINYNKSNEETNYLNKLLLDFVPNSQELLPFFYMKDDKKCFISQYYFDCYGKELMSTYNFSYLQELLSDYDKLITNIIKFYFIDITKEKLEECKSSVTAMSRLITNSKYSGDIKSSLYAFFLEPIPTIQKLIYDLIAKDFMLTQRYEKEFRKIIDLQQKVNINNISNKLRLLCNLNLDFFKEIYVTFCMFNKNCIKSIFHKDKIVLFLGYDYDDYLDYLTNANNIPKLDEFGNALSENNRIDILNLIAEKDEITIRDVEQELGFTGTNAYYHLSLMMKANMVKSRNQGRTILYSINGRYFKAVCDLLSKYFNKPEGDVENEKMD